MRVTLLLIAAFCAAPSFACSMAISRPVPYRASEYVLAGRVVSYIGPFEARGIPGEIWGLRLSDVVVVRPAMRARTIEVVPYGLAADCATVSYGRETIERRFPLDATVVVSGDSAVIAPEGESDPPRVEVSWGWGYVLAVTHLSASDAATRVIPWADLDRLPGSETSIADPELGQFELQKELARLMSSDSRQRIAILERLASWRDAPFDDLVNEYVEGAAARRKLHTLRRSKIRPR